MWRIKIFITGIKNLIYYLPVIWKDRDWDFAYVNDILEVKLKKVYKRYSTKEYFENQDKNTNKPLRICLELLKREHNRFYWKTSNYDKRSYSEDSKFKYCNADNCEYRNKEWLFDILKKYYVYWWD